MRCYLICWTSKTDYNFKCCKNKLVFEIVFWFYFLIIPVFQLQKKNSCWYRLGTKIWKRQLLKCWTWQRALKSVFTRLYITAKFSYNKYNNRRKYFCPLSYFLVIIFLILRDKKRSISFWNFDRHHSF